jgi:hypothetical protein
MNGPETTPEASPQRLATRPLPPDDARGNAVTTPLRFWLNAYRVEVALFVVSFFVLSMFSGQRFLRQSAAPHFVYQAQAWLEGRLDVDAQVLPNYEDWACVREVAGQKTRCTGSLKPNDSFYVSFPAFPSVAMLPFVWVNGYQLNDTSFGVIVGAFAVVYFFSLLRFLFRQGELERDKRENIAVALLLAFGTLFFYCAIRGEVWFLAEVMGVLWTCLYLRNSVEARRPVLAGLFFSFAAFTRTPLVFSALFFLIEALTPKKTPRLEQLKALGENWEAWREPLRKLLFFALGAAPVGLCGALYNHHRFGSVFEFGHRFFYNNRVNADIDTYGLFDAHYLWRNLEAAFLKLPTLATQPLRLSYDPQGLSLLLTLPLIVFLLVPKTRPRLHWPLWLTVAVVALPGFFYQNTGYMQFGFRFSLDYTPYLMLLFALGGWSLRNVWVATVAGLGVLVNFWGAVAFRGYTELFRDR